MKHDETDKISSSELQKIEAQWVYEEAQDFVRLIQRYRGIYITAIFISVGWVLGQMVGSVATSNNQPGQLVSSTLPPSSLEALRHRGDVAIVLCVIPLLNVLFVMLMLEAYAQIQSLARYRFILGIQLGEAQLGKGQPAWRWELWRSTNEGSIRAWTNSTNVFFGLVVIALTVAALWFAAPAAWDNLALWWVWMVALGFFVALVVVVVGVGLSRMRMNRVADKPTTRWMELTIQQRRVSWLSRVFLRLGKHRAANPSKRQRDV